MDQSAQNALPVAGPVAAHNGELAQAFAEAGAAYLKIAKLLGGGSFLPGPPAPGGIEVTPPATAAPGPSHGFTLREAINEFLLAKARAGRTDRYLRQLRVSLGSFAKGRAQRPLSALERAEVEKWLWSRDWSARTMRGYLGDLRALLSWSIKRGYLEKDLISWIELPADKNRLEKIAIHKAADVRAVLETARRIDLSAMRRYALRYFAGLRSAEVLRLREANILSEQNLIEVTADKSKTRRRRLIEIQPALRAWLDLGGSLDGGIDNNRLRRVIVQSGVPWDHNVTRHTWASAHYAHFGDAKKTSREAGHREEILFAHYRALMTPTEAAEHWQVFPARMPLATPLKPWGGPRKAVRKDDKRRRKA